MNVMYSSFLGIRVTQTYFFKKYHDNDNDINNDNDNDKKKKCYTTKMS